MKSIARQEIEGFIPEWLEPTVGLPQPIQFLTKFIIVVSLLCCWMPFIDLVLAVIGYWGVRKRESAWRTASLVSVGLAGVMSAVCLVMVLVDAVRR